MSNDNHSQHTKLTAASGLVKPLQQRIFRVVGRFSRAGTGVRIPLEAAVCDGIALR